MTDDEPDPGEPTRNTLVCPFLNADPLYAYGVEFGMLYVRLRNESEPVAGYFCRENQDQILLAASRLGWAVAEMKPWDEGWFWLRLDRRPAPTA